MSHLKVIEGWPGPRRLKRLAVAGVALGLINYFGEHQMTYTVIQTLPTGQRVPRSYELGLFLTVLVVIPATLFVLSFREQRPVRAMWEVAMLAGGFASGLGLPVLIHDFDTFLPLSFMAAVFMAACMVVRLVSLLVVRCWFRQLVVQPGLLCPGCAYNLTGNVSGVCPECGRVIG